MKRAQKPTQLERAKQTLDTLTPGRDWRITRYLNDDFYTAETFTHLGSAGRFELSFEQLGLIDSHPQEFVNLMTQQVRELGLLPYEPPVSENRQSDMEPQDMETMRRFLDGADAGSWLRAPVRLWRGMLLDGWVTMENYNMLVSDRNMHRDRAELLERDKAILISKNDEFAKIRDGLRSELETAEHVCAQLRVENEKLTAEVEDLRRRHNSDAGIIAGLRQDLDALGEANTHFADVNERLKQDLDSCERFTTELRPIRERDTEMLQHAEAVELVTAMLAGAGFELLRDPPGETAMWMQKLESRPIAQVFVMLTHEQLMLPPAQIYTLVKSQVGSS
jgi:hypothetical protein